MFDVGTKVVALTSSQKKSSGPRRGSVGYVASSWDGLYLEDMDMAVSKAEVIFTRYGFERNRERREKRMFINLFPVFKSLNKDVARATKDSIKDLHRTKFDKDYWKKLASDLEFKEGTPIGVLVPICDNGINLGNCSSNEFIAWLDSHLMSASFRNTLLSVRKSSRMEGETAKYVNILTDIAHNKEKKYEMLPIIESKQRGQTIHAIRMVEAIGVAGALRLENKQFISTASRVLSKYGLQHSHFYKGFIDGLYSLHKCKPRQAMLRGFGKDIINVCINNLEQTKLLLGASSSPLLRTGRKKEPKFRKEVNDFLNEF